MHNVISFESNIFDLDSERENSINPIKGLSVGEWFKPKLEQSGVKIGEIDEEDWGWYAYGEYQAVKYLFGFIAIPSERRGENPEIIVQIDRERSLLDKVLGKNKISASDEICKMLKTIVDATSDFTNVLVENNA